jgi:uncharacterized protein (TIGR02145 family)
MKRVLILPALMILCFVASGQIPQGINYQAVAFNSSGIPVTNTNLQVKAGILSDTLTPVKVWEELHSTVRTNSSGVFNLTIGKGTKQAGSATAFSEINWSITPLYLRIDIFYQNTWKYMGTAKLWSVPFAMAAGRPPELTALLTEVNSVETGAGLNNDGSYTANSSANYISSATSLKDADNKLDAQVKKNSDAISLNSKKLLIKGTETSNDSALFRVVNKNGQTVFAVYNEGVRIYVDDGTKGTKGGFAVGGFGTEKAPSQNLLFVSTDSIRAYIDTNSGKATKGGFAVGGFGTDKGGSQDYLRVTRDSTRIYLNNPGTKGVKGGFAVGGFDASKGATENYMLINPDSTRFYVRDLGSGNSSTFNIVGINQDQSQTLLMTANPDTVGIGGVLNVQNNLNVTGNIGYTGNVTLIVPQVVTIEPFNITDAEAMVTFDIVNDGGSPVLVSGVCWSTSPNPTDKLTTKTSDGGTTSGQHTSVITGLTESTTYYVRAYATNANGTGYGQQMTFITPAIGTTVVDVDGNVYNTVVIGTQTWIAKNLKTTRYNDGVPISCVKADASWMILATGGYTWYNNDSLTYADYGMLYNWLAVNTGILCPTGWHVPSDAEWSTLSAFLGGPLLAGGKLKEVDTAHWLPPNQNATNETGFTALPGGLRAYMGPFMDIGSSANFWTSTMISVDPANVILNTNNGQLTIGQIMSGMGHSVRCIKD